MEDAAYILQCRTNWFLGIRPADKFSKEKNEYKELVKIAKSYFDRNAYQEFAEYFKEGHYLIPLWTAHLILEYGKPIAELKDICLEVIRRYITNPLAPDVALQEREWLANFASLK